MKTNNNRASSTKGGSKWPIPRYRKNRGLFPSRKAGGMVKSDSFLEQEYMYLLEYDSDVDTFESQPIKIYYGLDGKKRR